MTAHPSDVESIPAILDALYSVISGDAGQARDWDRLRPLYYPGARLIPTGLRASGVSETSPHVMGVEEWIAAAAEFFATTPFYERELSRKIDTFGNIAHVWSTYGSYSTAESTEPFSRGINSIQLVHHDGRWWVMTIFWDSETPENPIPSKYLDERS